MESASYYIKHPLMFVYGCLSKISPIVPANIYIKIEFKARMGYRPDLKNPKTFNEKIQWLKLHDHNPNYSTMVDKYLVKDYIAKLIGKEYVIPTLGVWDKFDDIDFDNLPNQFVLKCNHDSGSVIICRDKNSFDKKYVKNKLEKALKFDYYNIGKEWVYKNIKPKIIAEKYMVDESGMELKDYKVFCFNGEPKLIQVDYNRFTAHKRNIYDLNWKFLPFEILYPSDKNHKIDKPICLEEVINLAKQLSKNIPHVRVDFYIINNKIYFGEMTFYHGGGYEEFRPKEWDYKLGEWIDLSDKIK